jgi:hypothetical protein
VTDCRSNVLFLHESTLEPVCEIVNESLRSALELVDKRGDVPNLLV